MRSVNISYRVVPSYNPKPIVLKQYTQGDNLDELLTKTINTREIPLNYAEITLKEIKKNNNSLKECVDFWLGRINEYKKMI